MFVTIMNCPLTLSYCMEKLQRYAMKRVFVGQEILILLIYIIKIKALLTIDKNKAAYLFQSRRSQDRIHRVQAWKILNAAAQEVGLSEIGTHTLRKTFGYHFYQKYKDVAVLQQIFNHSSPAVTMRYIGINQDIMDEKVDGFTL